MASFVALARAQLEEAKRRFKFRLYAHIATVALALAAQYAPARAAYLLTACALFSQAVAWFLKYQAVSMQSVGEEAKRRALLADAFGVEEEPREAADIRARMSTRAQEKAGSLDEPDYYASTHSPGPLRLRDHLQESTFWSKHLYEAAAERALLGIIVFVTAAVAVLILVPPLASRPTAFVVAKAVVVFLGFLPASDQVSNALSWFAAAKKSDQIDRRLDQVTEEKLVSLVAIFSDYAIATALAPPIPTKIYNVHSDRLNEEWSSR